ncbi:hypothetical protein VNO77_15381 [Canavalia gladiata]|uniref:Uncharacterized protein n=1 Tax=Canavalia gladiata TaxID=3824 RepID=A0AAN9M2N2_CANGL
MSFHTPYPWHLSFGYNVTCTWCNEALRWVLISTLDSMAASNTHMLIYFRIQHQLVRLRLSLPLPSNLTKSSRLHGSRGPRTVCCFGKARRNILIGITPRPENGCNFEQTWPTNTLRSRVAVLWLCNLCETTLAHWGSILPGSHESTSTLKPFHSLKRHKFPAMAESGDMIVRYSASLYRLCILLLFAWSEVWACDKLNFRGFCILGFRTPQTLGNLRRD